mmetsp:Transcript_97493/g.179159  ORF Transcript_97493/g.179159 Transcript_97493/m.179159 type:complete len:107 (-) Transcript_97493:210-530(-)
MSRMKLGVNYDHNQQTKISGAGLEPKKSPTNLHRQFIIAAELSQPRLQNRPKERASQQFEKKVLHLPTMMSIFSSVSSGNIGSERSCGALFDVLGSCPAYTSISFL